MAKRVRVGEDKDRISSLPDDLLCHIISFLPLNEAFRTSILSTRWSKIFTLIPNLNFENSFTSRKSNSLNFMNFVDRMLFYHVGVVDKFRLMCGEFIESYRVDGWIRYALHNNVRELELCLNCREFTLPVRVFTCKTLVILRLETYGRCKFVLKVPAKICLPNLRILHLSGIRISDDGSIRNFFSSSSVLEELVVERCMLNKQCKFYVSNPALKRLTIAYTWGFYEDYEILIDAPSLIYLRFCSLPKRFIFKNPNSLVEAYISFGTVLISHELFIEYNTAATHLFKGISDVQSLHLSGNFAELFLTGSSIIPELPKLTSLSLDDYFFVGWETVLSHLLECFPRLEALVFRINHQNSSIIHRTTLPPKRFPSFLWSQLKRLKILSFGGKKDELQMVEYFLKNAKVLENFTVESRERQRKPEKWRSKIAKTLLNLPKASEKCKVLIL